jgi:predicted transcriptional regulator
LHIVTPKAHIDVTTALEGRMAMERTATTVRIDPVVKEGLSKLSRLEHRSLNQLANQAIKEFVARRMIEVEHDLESTLEDLRAYRKRDADFEHAIAAVVDAELAAKDDPAEGRVVTPVGPTEAIMLDLLNE